MSRFTSETRAAVSPLQPGLVNVKLGLERQGQERKAFEVEVVCPSLIGDAIPRLEGRLCGLISLIQNEVRATCKKVLDAVLESRPHGKAFGRRHVRSDGLLRPGNIAGCAHALRRAEWLSLRLNDSE